MTLTPAELERLLHDKYLGITLVTLDEGFRRTVEPGAAPIEKRMEALNRLHNQGYKTWVSIEPYPTPNIHEGDLSALLDRIGFVDRIVF